MAAQEQQREGVFAGRAAGTQVEGRVATSGRGRDTGGIDLLPPPPGGVAAQLVGAYGVADQVNAKVVRVTAGAPVVTDGPYAEAKEYLGSFTVVDCDSLERALEIAARNPAARYWGVEVRPLMHEANVEP